MSEAMATPRRHPIHSMPFDDGDVANALEEEYRERSPGQRFLARRKVLARDLALLLSGQARRHVQAVPASTRRLLWVHTWTTVGDAILDLAPRRLIPSTIDVDLLIAPVLAPLFRTDRRFRAVISSAGQCAADYDFILLDSLRTGSLRMKAERFRNVQFATLRGHQAGERFDRAAFADRRMRQLFGLPSGPVEAPMLDLGEDRPSAHDRGHFRIALALGGRLQKKLYARWPEVLEALVAAWPATLPQPEFVLVGQGASAKAQRDAIDHAATGAATTSLISSGSLRKTAVDIASCDAFLGVDGGLMQIAIGVGTPGLALFSRTDPAYFLRPGSTVNALASEGELDDLAPAAVAAAFLARLPGFSAGR